MIKIILDVDMINISGIGVAMENAVNEVKQIADFITLSNNDNGVAYYLEKFVIK